MTLSDVVNRMLETGVLPDAIVRRGIRQVLRARLRQEQRLQRTQAFAQTLSASPIAVATDRANAQHYEVPAAFFAQVLGPHLKYSACLWDPSTRTLAQAEDSMLALTATRADLHDGQRVLELGCGWGSLTLYMAEHFPASTIVAVSNSQSQRAFIETTAARRGLHNVRVITADMNSFSPASAGIAERFDRVVSVEMFEHMRNYPRLLARIASWLKDEGRLFVHIFAHREFAYPYEHDGPSDWMAEHFFTGGTMPSEDLLPSFRADLELDAQWRVNGVHYARTCDAWLHNMDAHRTEVNGALTRAYGASSVRQWRARWRIFFMACSELFAFNDGNEWVVAHYRFRKPLSC